MLKKMLIISTAFLMLAPAARADHDRDDRRVERPRLVELAHRLDDDARRAHRAAEHRIPPYGRFERATLASLHRLEQRARHFHQQLERGRSEYRHVRRDFYRVLDAYDVAARNVVHLRSHGVRKDFRRVERDIDRLARALDVAHGGRPAHDDDYAHRGRTHGSVVFGDSSGRTRYDVRVRW